MAKASYGLPIPRDLVEFVLLGPAEDHRQLQDSPLLGDVWLAYAASPAESQDLLITPHTDSTAGRVAKTVSDGLRAVDSSGARHAEAKVAYLQGIVAAKLLFKDVLRILVPITSWWIERNVPNKLKGDFLKQFHLRFEELLRAFPKGKAVEKSGLEPVEKSTLGSANGSESEYFGPIERYVALAGMILWAAKQKKPARRGTALDATSVKNKIEDDITEIIRKLAAIFRDIEDDWTGGWAAKMYHTGAQPANLIFSVSLNRRATAAVDKSVPAVKADAARSLFQISCDKITWAILDSGIHRNHEAFTQVDKPSRVRKTFDFTRVRDIASCDDPDEAIDADRVTRLARGTGLTTDEVSSYLRQLADDARRELPRNWALIEKLVFLKDPPAPFSVHGTHVAGILGAAGKDGDMEQTGMCPDIQLCDFRVLSRTLIETEFAIIAALQYIRYLNESHNYITIHGANLSLSIPHDVGNYACGCTPVCVECERLVNSGVVVVAAAGNRGYQKFEVKEGLYEGYVAFSVTDPGNADGVITVGSTHRFWPHTYGVSFFSSRGPTGDGRLKPDLVAPGERIEAPMCGTNEWGFQSGTSMAAPHVSGAAAMLMARYPELIGQPRRIKRILCETATDLGRERSFQGHGMLDVLRALQSV